MRFTESVRHWLNAQFPWREIKELDQETLAQLARDNAMAVSDFCTLAKSKSGNSELLRRQLAQAGLDPEKVADTKSSVMRDMQIVCSDCSMTRRCRRSLSRQSAAPTYSAYCPNALTIDALIQDFA
ncbi:hypothetical protein ACXIUS_20495 [Bosea thiooxidans]|jgi:hypothetical protein